MVGVNHSIDLKPNLFEQDDSPATVTTAPSGHFINPKSLPLTAS
jgi:hypothetical protein